MDRKNRPLCFFVKCPRKTSFFTTIRELRHHTDRTSLRSLVKYFIGVKHILGLKHKDIWTTFMDIYGHWSIEKLNITIQLKHSKLPWFGAKLVSTLKDSLRIMIYTWKLIVKSSLSFLRACQPTLYSMACLSFRKGAIGLKAYSWNNCSRIPGGWTCNRATEAPEL